MGGGRKQRQEEKETGGRGNCTQERGSIVFLEFKHATVFVSASVDGPHMVLSERELKIRKRERKQKLRAHKDLNWAIC